MPRVRRPRVRDRVRGDVTFTHHEKLEAERFSDLPTVTAQNSVANCEVRLTDLMNLSLVFSPVESTPNAVDLGETVTITGSGLTMT